MNPGFALRRMPRWISLISGLLITVLLTVTARTHDIKTGYLLVDSRGDSLSITVKIDITDLERVFHLDVNRDQVVDREELLAKVPGIYAFLNERLTLRLDYLRSALHRQEGSFEQDPAGNLFINFNFDLPNAGQAATLGIHLQIFDRFGADYKVLGRLRHQGRVQQMIFTEATPLFQFDLREGGASLVRQLRAFALLGIEHIFIGIDHIMFLFGLLVIGGRFLDLVKIVTSFTISHSITLILAALQIVALPGWLIESAIALSIVYIAGENFFVQKIDTRWVVTGLFGLIHGFGFANVLGDLGLPSRALVPSLFAFNLGVEIGQIVIVTLFLPLVWLIMKTAYQRLFVRICSAIILFFGATWFLERAFGLPVALL